MLAVDPDFASCGTKWLDKEDSCHRSIQIASQRAKCRREEAHAMLLKTPSDARSITGKKRVESFWNHYVIEQ